MLVQTVARLVRYITWEASMILGAFATAAVTLAAADFSVRVWLSVLVLGGGLAVIAALNARQDKQQGIRQKQIDWMFDLDRQFSSMREARIRAAEALLETDERDEIGPDFTGAKGRLNEVDPILDFFSTPVASMTLAGQLAKDDVYNYFFEWIRGYWHATLEYRKSQTDHTKWSNFTELYEIVFAIYKSKSRPEDWEFKKADVEAFLRDELRP